MNIASEVFQKYYEDPTWFQEELVYFFKDSGEWISEVWKYTKDDEGNIENTELVEEKSYPKGSKPKLEDKFPWLRYHDKWTPYKSKQERYGS